MGEACMPNKSCLPPTPASPAALHGHLALWLARRQLLLQVVVGGLQRRQEGLQAVQQPALRHGLDRGLALGSPRLSVSHQKPALCGAEEGVGRYWERRVAAAEQRELGRISGRHNLHGSRAAEPANGPSCEVEGTSSFSRRGCIPCSSMA